VTESAAVVFAGASSPHSYQEPDTPVATLKSDTPLNVGTVIVLTAAVVESIHTTRSSGLLSETYDAMDSVEAAPDE
jgi:hypothetical protein